MKIKNLILVLGVILTLFSCNKNDDPEIETPSPRTVLMYLVADNSIGYDVVANITDVEKGFQANDLTDGTFVIYCDGGRYLSTYSSPTMFKYEIKSGKVSDRQVIKTYEEQNSCDPAVITNVLKDMKALCPAESYAFTFGSHATGWLPASQSTRSVGDDDGSKINLPEFADAIEDSGLHFDYILMDACLMSQVEVAYELRNVADYLILSPAEVMAYGFPYKDMIYDMMRTGNEESIAISMAQTYIDYYKTYEYPWATIAVIKSSEMQDLADATSKLISDNRSSMAKFTTSKLNKMQNSCNYARSSMTNSSYDFQAFARELTDDNIPAYFLNALSDVVVYKDYVNGYRLTGVNIDADCYSGIGCYIPYESYQNWNDYFKSLGWNKAVKMIED
jgi:hypothetical protein